jgi:hypothetical protein
MANATYQKFSFLGGEISQWALGRVDREQYVHSLNVCFNGFPVEAGTWVRRPGTMFAGTTRFAAPGRVLRWDFEAAIPYTIELTDNWMRFRQGLRLTTDNAPQTVLAISSANPAVVRTAAASGWVNGNDVMFSTGNGMPALDNRVFQITAIDSTHFSLQDGTTGANIDGSTLGTFLSGTVERLHVVETPYNAGTWAQVRIIQAETTAVMLAPNLQPQILTVATLPGPATDALFSLAALVFLDGPYLDPPVNGAQVTPSGTTGKINLTLGFPAYDSTKAYKVGDFVVSSSVNYESLVDQNVGNTPASSPTQWVAVSAGAAINNGQGWVGTDIGRLVRLFSEPALWDPAHGYSSGNVVSYNPSGLPGGATYWQAQTSTTGNPPGADTTHWSILPTNQAAVWSWGRIISLGNQISQGVSGAANIGNMTTGGTLSAAFDGVTSQSAAASAAGFGTGGYVGRHFGGGAEAIGSVTVYPSNDEGFAGIRTTPGTVRIDLYANNSAPVSSTDGTLIGTTGIFTDGLTAVTIQSTSSASWNYVWVVITAVSGETGSLCAELQFFNPPGTGTGSVAVLEVLGPALLYTNPCITWRLGVYSGTTGYPTCGCYHEGRIWLGGAVANRFDASVSNGIVGNTINFAPTDQYGTVGSANGISEVLNSDGVNPISWMIPDLQGVIMGTLAGEWLIEPLQAGAMAPNNIAARPVPKIGCANIQPVRTEHTTIFVHRYQRKLMEGFADVYSGKFSAPNLARWAGHITAPQVAELAYTDAVTPIVWGRNIDGSWFGVTYKRDALTTTQEPTYAAFHRHALGSGRTVVSICGGPSIDGTRDALTMVTLDAATGHYGVEVLTDVPDEGSTLLDATYLDNAINPSSVTSSNVPIANTAPYGGLTINGLWHLNGKTVTAWLGGLDCGDYVVSNGSIFVPYGDGISAGTGSGLFTATYAGSISLTQMLIGFDFISQGQPTRPASPAESGARNGPALGKLKRSPWVFAQLEGTAGIKFSGYSFADMRTAIFKSPGGKTYAALQTFTGIFRDQFPNDYDLDGMICWQVNRGYPANIVSIGAPIATQDI